MSPLNVTVPAGGAVTGGVKLPGGLQAEVVDSSWGAARPIVMFVIAEMSRASVASFGTTSRGRSSAVPFSVSERIAGRLPKPVSSSPSVISADDPSDPVAATQ